MLLSGFNWSVVRTRCSVPVLLNFMEAEKVCEVGVRDGGFFKYLLSPESVKHAWAIDIWDNFLTASQNDIGRPVEKVAESYRCFSDAYRHDKRVVILKQDSATAFEKLPFDMDFIYLDADHTYNAIKQDLNNFWGRLRKGGVLAGHDYENYYFRGLEMGVKTAVDEFVKDNNLKLHVTLEPRFKSFFIVK